MPAFFISDGIDNIPDSCFISARVIIVPVMRHTHDNCYHDDPVLLPVFSAAT